MLLVVGVSFVSIAALVFLTVAFVLFDLTVKAVITAAVTAGVIPLASWLKRRELVSTAEGAAILGVVLLLLDMWAVQALNLWGLDRIDGTLYWGLALLCLTTVFLAWGRLSNLRAPRIASSFTLGPGVFALTPWIFDWSLSESSALMVGLAAIALSSLLAPRLHRVKNRASLFEIGVLYGVGQLASAYLFLRVLWTIPMGGVEETLVGAVVSLVGTGSVLGQIWQLRRHGSLAPIHWLRIPAAILSTLLWAAAMLAISREIASESELRAAFPSLWKAAPVVAFAAVFWDVLHLRSSRPDRRIWITGMASATLAALPPGLLLAVGIGFIPFQRDERAIASDYGADFALLSTGFVTIAVAALAVAAYRGAARSAAGHSRRVTVAGVIGAVGISMTAVALPLVPSIVVLVTMMVGSVVVAWRLRDRDLDSKNNGFRFILHGAFVAASVGLVLVSFLHTPLRLVTFVGVGAGLLLLRLARGRISAMPLTLATAFMTIVSTFVSWGPHEHPIVAAITILALPVALLLVATHRSALESTDRRVLVGTSVPMLMVAATQQLPLAFIHLDRPLAENFWAVVAALAIAAITYVLLVRYTLRAFRRANADALTHSAALAATLPLTYIAMSPIVQVVAGQTSAPISEIMLVGVLAVTALGAAAGLTLFRLNGVPDRWTLGGDCLAIAAALVTMTNFFVLTIPQDLRLTPTALIALAISVAVPLTVAAHSSGRPRPGAFRGTFPWISAAFLALFGPLFVIRIVESPWPVLVAAPVSIALIVSAIVFHVSGAARLTRRGAWLGGAMFTLGSSVALVALLSSRDSTNEVPSWAFPGLAAVISIAGLGFAAVSSSRHDFLPTRQLLAATLAPLMTIATIVAVHDILAVIPTGTDAVNTVSAYLLAGTVCGSSAVAIGLLNTSTRNALGNGAHAFLRRSALVAVIVIVFCALAFQPQTCGASLLAWLLTLMLLVVPTTDTVAAHIHRIAAATALVLAAASTLFATTSDQHLAHPAIAWGITATGVAVAALTRRVPPIRVLTFIMIPVSAWGALLAVPAESPWWMLAAAGAVSVSFSAGAAVFRRRIGTDALWAAVIATVLPIVTAVFADDGSVRAWPFTWLSVGMSLIALSLALTRVLSILARGLGAVLALVSSANLLWPNTPDPTVLLVALPGCALLAALAFGARAHRAEASAYAAAIPLWFTAVTVAAQGTIPGDWRVIIMIGMLAASVTATAAATLLQSRRPMLWLPLTMLSNGSGVAAVVMAFVSRRVVTSFPDDLYPLAFGIALTAIGGCWLRARPQLRSFPTLGPGLAVTLLPLWFITAQDPTPTRIGIYAALVLFALLAGALGRLQAPLLLGSVAAFAHLVVAVRWMLPELSVPWWVSLGSTGAVLIFVAATYEARLRNARTFSRSLARLR